VDSLIDHSDEVGWPHQAPDTKHDTTTLHLAPRRQAERDKEAVRALRYRQGPSRQRYLASQRRQNELSGLIRGAT
jgi:hypothetical protein